MGLVHATWFDYGESTIGPYREFSIGVLASRQTLGFSTLPRLVRGEVEAVGSYVLALPVDSEAARVGGVKLYGLPKTRLDFTLRWARASLEAELLDEGRPQLTMQFPLRRGLSVPMRRLVIYSMRNGQLITTSISMRWHAQLDLVGRPRLRVSDPDQPLGRLIGELGMESARVLAITHGRLEYAELPVPIRGSL